MKTNCLCWFSFASIWWEPLPVQEEREKKDVSDPLVSCFTCSSMHINALAMAKYLGSSIYNSNYFLDKLL